ncbi:carboxypeptidase regulatory-like domain-containing protein [Actinoplanes sp. NBRC 103695]|uniref:carboxypeptidase regulatory-like domain-containing protein n=1 Tax=Actinoplanes sp. NBRC 103695 TaxID=3032202 RepID=UPI0024A1F949|nr:carboxypeptidase regulatory-like domain-containing protein [Actinoplanes sp. NBRC 103695]GLY98099.1 hypothetical protein Acsp02_53530 [Actinoplanes sp. NBRC 103695]
MLRKVLSVLAGGALAAGLVVVGPAAPALAADVWIMPVPQTGTVRGVFTDRAGEPIAGATVYSDSPDYNHWSENGTTDAQGRYLLEDVPAGRITMAFSDHGLTQYAPGRPSRDDAQVFTVVPGLITVVDERQVPLGTIEGRLTDAAGNPSADVSVRADPVDYLFSTASSRTDADGRYSIPRVPSGPVQVEFQSGQRHQWARDANSKASARVFTVRGGQTLTVDESWRPTGTLSGQITGATGPVSVTVAEVDGDGYHHTTTTADGRFTLDVPSGRWRIQLDFHQWLPAKINEADGKVFRVAAGETTEVTESLRPTGSLRVSLRTSSGGVSQWSFGLWHNGEKVESLSGTNTGSRTFDDLLPGDYLVSYDNYFAPGTLRIEDATPVKVRAGREKRLTITHPKNGALSGRVTLPSGEPAPGIEVQAAVEGEPFPRTAETGTDGEWTMNLFPATYDISLNNQSDEFTQQVGSATVTSGGSTTLDATWQQGGSLTVNAVDATTGDPVTGFCVAVIAKFGDYCTEGSTVAVAGLQAGPTLVTLRALGGSDYLEKPDVPVTIPEGGHATLTVPLTLGGRINAEVVDRATGSPVGSACIIPVEPETGGDEVARACTNNQGKTTTAALAPGVYQLFAESGNSKNGAQWFTPEGGTGDQREATKFRVKAGKTTKAGTVLLDQAGKISGVVRDPAGQPAAGVNVGLRAFEIPGSADYPPDDTDAQGRYTVDGLGPYSWPLLFTPDWDVPRQWSGATGNRYQAETVPVTSGATSTYDVTLAAGTKVTGTATVTPGGTASSGGVLKARNAATGDLLAVGEVPGPGGRYSFTVIGGSPVVVEWYLADPVTKSTGWYDGAADFASATKVPVPASGTKRLDLTIGSA